MNKPLQINLGALGEPPRNHAHERVEAIAHDVIARFHQALRDAGVDPQALTPEALGLGEPSKRAIELRHTVADLAAKKERKRLAAGGLPRPAPVQDQAGEVQGRGVAEELEPEPGDEWMGESVEPFALDASQGEIDQVVGHALPGADESMEQASKEDAVDLDALLAEIEAVSLEASQSVTVEEAAEVLESLDQALDDLIAQQAPEQAIAEVDDLIDAAEDRHQALVEERAHAIEEDLRRSAENAAIDLADPPALQPEFQEDFQDEFQAEFLEGLQPPLEAAGDEEEFEVYLPPLS